MLISPVFFVLVAFIIALMSITGFYMVQCGVARVSTMLGSKEAGPSIQ